MAKSKTTKKSLKTTIKKNNNGELNTIKWTLSAFIPMLVATIYVYTTAMTGHHLALVRENITEVKFENVNCSEDYQKHEVFPGCTPINRCGRSVTDGLVNEKDALTLQNLLLKGMKHGGGSGGASILDLHTGALSMGTQFVNLYNYADKEALGEIFTEADMKVYSSVKERIKLAISQAYGIQPEVLHLTSPTFFSQMTSKIAQTQHDEYWHGHIDKIQYGSFDYTSLLYLSTYEQDFVGGRFIFDSDKASIEPKLGRVSFFTSGSENPHHVEKVNGGVRLALTVAFTCDPKKAIKDPKVIVK